MNFVNRIIPKVFVPVSVVLCLTLFQTNDVCARHSNAQSNSLIQIEKDYLAGKITFDQKCLFEVQTIKNPSELPPQYEALQDAELTTGKEATMVLKEIRMRWSDLSPETQLAISEALTRQTTDFTYDSPSGFFKLHYDVLGTDAVPSADTNT